MKLAKKEEKVRGTKSAWETAIPSKDRAGEGICFGGGRGGLIGISDNGERSATRRPRPT